LCDVGSLKESEGTPEEDLGPDLQKILRQSEDCLTIMTKLTTYLR